MSWSDLPFECTLCGKNLKEAPRNEYHVTDDDRVYCEDCKEVHHE